MALHLHIETPESAFECSVAKYKAAAKRMASLMKCSFKLEKGGDPDKAVDCVFKSETKLALAFQKAEAKSVGTCGTTNDAASRNGFIRSNINYILQRLYIDYL